MSLFTWLWVAWGVAFAVIEGVALFNDRQGDTLSEHFRKWFSTKEKKGRTLWVFISIVFFAWFTLHIAFDGTI